MHYCLDQSAEQLDAAIARVIYDLVCRTDFNRPGFIRLRQEAVHSSLQQRRSIVRLKELLSELHYERLDWYNVNRFDQANTTKLHRDGGPAESLIILGYEPSDVRSELFIADYSKCAFENGLTPEEFLAEYNPMYDKGLQKLQSYTTRVDCFSAEAYQLVVINNSCTTYDGVAWQGVLHGANIEDAGSGLARKINSTLVCRARDAVARVSDERLQQFVSDDNFLSDNYLAR